VERTSVSVSKHPTTTSEPNIFFPSIRGVSYPPAPYMESTDLLPSPGQFVRVRGRRWLVEDLDAVPSEDTRVRLACVDDDAAGFGLDVLWERELDAAVLGAEAFGGAPVKSFDRPDLFGAYLDTLRWSSVTSTKADLFQAPYRAGISIKAHQLEPLRKALHLPRVNLLIADDVGLGKTIEAGLILRELLLRQRVRRIVVACPPSVVLQWQNELENRFGLSFRVLDRAYVLRMRRERGHATNPWNTHHQFIISHALLRDESYASLLRRVLDESREGSLLILDEAHNAAPSSSGKYAVDSRFTRVVRDIAHRFEHKLFLSATPHNGHSNSFSALLEILDNTRFCRGAPVEPSDRDAVVVRRLKRDIRHAVPGEFPERKIVEHRIEGLSDDAPEIVLSKLLDQYREKREARTASLPKTDQATAALVIISLQKRLLSSIHAFHHTLKAHRKYLETKRGAKKAAPVVEAQLAMLLEPPDMDDDRAEMDEATVRAEEDAALRRAESADPSAPSSEEMLLLDRMIEMAARTKDLSDPRVDYLVTWIRENLCPEGKWNDRRLIVFTEYADTKDYLLARLRDTLGEPEQPKSRIKAFHGGIGDEQREDIKNAFNADPRTEPLRILICTDAAREGVNLQNHCADLVHFDLPWNPARVEQRNGRIDRTLQTAPEVRCHYFFFTQRAEDRVLETMVKKTVTIANELGSVGSVVTDNLALLLEKGIPLAQVNNIILAMQRLGDDPEKAAARKTELEETQSRKAVDEQLITLRALLQSSQKHIDFSGERLRRALDASLAILNESPVESVVVEGSKGNIHAFRFPDLMARKGADPSWFPLLDLLRGPREKGESLWDWRRRAPLLPVVFEDPRTLSSGVVHLHLEHPVVRRLLGRFAAQGFVHDDLSRACVLRTRDALPRVVLYGRVALYGPAAARLHDEIVAVSGVIESSTLRLEENAAEALRLVRASLDDAALCQVDPSWTERELLPRVTPDVEVLRKELDKHFDRKTKEAKKELEGRGKTEAAALRKVIADQEKRLVKHKAEVQKKFPELRAGQQLLGFSAKEYEQIQDDIEYWDKRILELKPQADAEADRIKQHYTVGPPRCERVGLVYLWPLSG